jgi:hypothetical protein
VVDQPFAIANGISKFNEFVSATMRRIGQNTADEGPNNITPYIAQADRRGSACSVRAAVSTLRSPTKVVYRVQI